MRLSAALVMALLASLGVVSAWLVAMPIDMSDRLVWAGLLFPLLWPSLVFWVYWSESPRRSLLLLALASLASVAVVFAP
ncbi:MAG: hypothetical protein RLN99_19175 [Kiloniellaceae bacterium]